ncbi:MAG: hypothetical protein A3J97_02940 [Spirochaetes bacterium RIFOXYC1_FULL_54_7]|nr:MAG: hypothetical protein A3J97_02940 [Spirochaetes bacterium RIFOXYC1_FULL_54_7]
MILGNLMGSVIVPASLVLGIVAIICPITVDGMNFFVLSRFFIIFAALLFFFFTKTERLITLREGGVLVFMYLIFLTTILIGIF